MTTIKPTGFAPAATPHASTAVHTSDENIVSGETSIPSQGDNMPAFHARPRSVDGSFQGLVTKVPDSQVLADLDHVASWAYRHGGDAHRLLITGFCWGGRITWLYAAHNPQLKAAVAWYGKLVGEKTLNSPKHPVDVAVDLNAPVLGLYGAKDDSIPQDTVETMRQALRAANATAEIVVYPQAGHAFNADYRASYHEESAKDGWQRMLAWFAQYGGKRG